MSIQRAGSIRDEAGVVTTSIERACLKGEGETDPGQAKGVVKKNALVNGSEKNSEGLMKHWLGVRAKVIPAFAKQNGGKKSKKIR